MAMANPTLPQLQAMKRTELQALCKENELKANGKTNALISLLAAHFSSEEEAAPSPPALAKKAPATKAKKGSKAPQVLEKVPVVEEEEDEMRIGTPEGKKVDKAGKVVQEARVYATSPGTKATIASLISTVHSLQNDLTAARSALVDLEATVAHLPAPQSPKLSKAEILALVDAKIDDYRSELDERVERLSVEMQAMEERSLGTKEGFVDEVLAVQDATKEWKDALEGVVSEFRQDVSTRLSALEHSPAAVQRSPIRQLQLPAPSPSYSDAPPTKSMTAFSSPSPTRSLTRSPGGRSLSLVPTSARKSPRKLSNLALPSHLVYPRSPRPTAAPESPVGPSTRALGKRTRDSDASDLSIEVLLSPPTRREEGGGMMAALFSTEKEVGHVRKRVRVNDDAASSSEEGDSFDQSTEMSRSSIRADVVVQTKSGDETPSTSDPSFFSSSRLSLPSTSLPAPLAARKSLPMATLPFPLVSPFKRPTLSPFGELSNASPKKGKVPPTPEAKRTLYGTEEESRFEDLVSAEEEFASPVKSAGKQQWARLGAWGGFGGK